MAAGLSRKRLSLYRRKHPIKSALIITGIVLGTAAFIAGCVITGGLLAGAAIVGGAVGVGVLVAVGGTTAASIGLGVTVGGAAVTATTVAVGYNSFQNEMDLKRQADFKNATRDPNAEPPKSENDNKPKLVESSSYINKKLKKKILIQEDPIEKDPIYDELIGLYDESIQLNKKIIATDEMENDIELKLATYRHEITDLREALVPVSLMIDDMKFVENTIKKNEKKNYIKKIETFFAIRDDISNKISSLEEKVSTISKKIEQPNVLDSEIKVVAKKKVFTFDDNITFFEHKKDCVEKKVEPSIKNDIAIQLI